MSPCTEEYCLLASFSFQVMCDYLSYIAQALPLTDGAAPPPGWALPYHSLTNRIFHRLYHRLFWSTKFSVEFLFSQVTPGCVKLTITCTVITFYFIFIDVLGIKARPMDMLGNGNYYYQHLTLWDLRLNSFIITIHPHKHTLETDGAATGLQVKGLRLWGIYVPPAVTRLEK